MERYNIEKPAIKDIDETSVFSKYMDLYDGISSYLDRVNEKQYLYWTEARYKTRPEGMSPEEFWVLIKLSRRFASRPLPVLDQKNANFTWLRQDNLERVLNKMDLELGGKMLTSVQTNENHQKFVARGLLEEAIASSQLEGASTTRRVAREMIAEQRAPRNKSEQMIYNNYVTMRLIESEILRENISREMLLTLHAKLVDKTMDEDEQKGRFRTDKDEIVIVDEETQKVLYIPPTENTLKRELDRLIAYANDEDGPFLHPIIKAIVIHFWLAYLHPFVDGNGRMARTLFYWYLLKHDYWMISYVPISTVIKRAQAKYKEAYLFAEQDGSDMTYFISYHIERLVKATDELKDYVSKIDAENKQIDSIIDPKYALNDRQKQLIHYLVAENMNATATITSHQTLNGISRLTADRDLKDLQEKGLVANIKVGRTYNFFASEKLKGLAKAIEYPHAYQGQRKIIPGGH
jgi:Fic family protein